MDAINWLIRKYPKSCGLITERFDIETINKHMKKENYVPAMLKEDVSDWEAKYVKDTIFLFKRTKEYDEAGHEEYPYYCGWTGDFVCYGLFKCGKDITSSGYHHIYIGKDTKIELLN